VAAADRAVDDMTATLRLAPAQPADAPTDAEAPPVVILIVDDNSKKRLALKSVLTPLGYLIVEADSGVAALRCVLEQNFAVILLDVRMPIMDGFETAALIRQRRESEMTPIIFITANGSDEVAQTDRYAEGAVDFIFSPINPAEMRAKVSVFANLFIRAELLAVESRRVRATADHLRLLTDAAPIGIFETDAANRYVYTNPRWSEISGVSAKDALGQRLGSLDRTKTPAGVDALRADPQMFDGNLCRRVEIQVAGASRFVFVTSRSIPDADGGIAGWVGTLADVTAEAGAETAMSEAHDAAVAANAMQKNFAASASHELRTPTTSILGYTEEVLESTDLAEQDRHHLEVVYRNAKRLALLIDDLLVVGEAEIGATMMHVVPTALAPLVEGVMASFSAAAQRADISLVTNEARDTPAALVDALRFEQVLANLVSNAVKFTPNGGKVAVAIKKVDSTVQVSVTDTGIGIAEAEIGSIFDRFYRSTAAIQSAIAGSGLGLAIAKRMIEAQNGELHVTSKPGTGSTFTVTLPVATRELQDA
jgi:PAS domain S-box-containing protein